MNMGLSSSVDRVAMCVSQPLPTSRTTRLLSSCRELSKKLSNAVSLTPTEANFNFDLTKYGR